MMMPATADLLASLVTWIVLRKVVLIRPVPEAVQAQSLLLKLGQHFLWGQLLEQLAKF
jgi:hypothetical protein